ncbi:NmrA family NAD(P)-binding protein [Sphingomonas aurantiaca]|uniref:NmrA family NAD(P)-binding protein n=1 Tax=Sphingomonas aurantiaca TaxID=185949 RepID=UPI002FE21506
MNDTVSNVKSRNILVLGAGELGMPVLRNLARHAKGIDGAKISVLLRESAVESGDPSKQRDIAEIREAGIEIVLGDLVNDTIDELASLFSDYDTVIGCAGYAAGINTPIKLAKAALQSGIPRYFPWQFGVDFEAIGRGGPQDIFDARARRARAAALAGQDRVGHHLHGHVHELPVRTGLWCRRSGE